jgi:hypothetical protein
MVMIGRQGRIGMTQDERELLLYAANRSQDFYSVEEGTRFRQLLDKITAAHNEARQAPKVEGFELIGTSPHPILSMAVINDYLIVATTHGVFERSPDGTIRELRLEPERS